MYRDRSGWIDADVLGGANIKDVNDILSDKGLLLPYTIRDLMKKLALLGRKLGHTFSPKYFAEKFRKEGILDYKYGTIEMADVSEFPEVLRADPDLVGFNVTIPYKTVIIEYLDQLDETAEYIGAVNTIVVREDGLKGYNTDVIGFRKSLQNFLSPNFHGSALVLGTGGSSKAVHYVLDKLKIPFKFISRKPVENGFTYEQLDATIMKEVSLIINTTPVGMYPHVDQCPDIPYQALGEAHYLYDLIYNPEETLFMERGKEQGAKVTNGYAMLELQAEASWEIWNEVYGK